jgi:hypothetical protein
VVDPGKRDRVYFAAKMIRALRFRENGKMLISG